MTPALADRPAVIPAVLDVNAVAEICTCSSRHIYRMEAAGLMPGRLKLGALVRWSRAEIDKWIADGCKPVGEGK